MAVWIEPPARLPDGFVPPSASIHPPRARRVWHPDGLGVVHAVITHDDGGIYTVQPNTAEQALREAAAYSAGATPIQIRFPSDYGSDDD